MKYVHQRAGAGRQSVPARAQPQPPGNLQPGRARRAGHGLRGALRHSQGNVRQHAGRHGCRCIARRRGARCWRGWIRKVARGLLERCERKAYTAATITTPGRAAGRTGIRAPPWLRAFQRRKLYPGDITVSAAVLDAGGTPQGAVNVSVPSSRWSFEQAQAVFGPQVVETARHQRVAHAGALASVLRTRTAGGRSSAPRRWTTTRPDRGGVPLRARTEGLIVEALIQGVGDAPVGCAAAPIPYYFCQILIFQSRGTP